MHFSLPVENDPALVLRPDVACVSFDRWPDNKPFSFCGNPLDVVPELLVEVVSPNDLHKDVSEKVDLYLEAGVQVVWIVDPFRRSVLAYRADSPTFEFRASDTLTAEPVLPGFAVPVKDLFPPVAGDR
jgi:Uma2 family endonuclease